MVWYFAYGSNMQSATLRGRRGVEYKRALPTRLPGWKLVLDKPSLIREGHTFANIVPDAESEVCGVCFEISEDDLAHIDLTEGVLIGNYARIPVTVHVLDEISLELPAFTLTSEKRHHETYPSTRYMGLLIDGALEHGLPVPYVDFLRSIPCGEESAQTKELTAMIDSFLRKPER